MFSLSARGSNESASGSASGAAAEVSKKEKLEESEGEVAASTSNVLSPARRLNRTVFTNKGRVEPVRIEDKKYSEASLVGLTRPSSFKTGEFDEEAYQVGDDDEADDKTEEVSNRRIFELKT